MHQRLGIKRWKPFHDQIVLMWLCKRYHIHLDWFLIEKLIFLRMKSPPQWLFLKQFQEVCSDIQIWMSFCSFSELCLQIATEHLSLSAMNQSYKVTRRTLIISSWYIAASKVVWWYFTDNSFWNLECVDTLVFAILERNSQVNVKST